MSNPIVQMYGNVTSIVIKKKIYKISETFEIKRGQSINKADIVSGTSTFSLASVLGLLSLSNNPDNVVQSILVHHNPECISLVTSEGEQIVIPMKSILCFCNKNAAPRR